MRINVNFTLDIPRGKLTALEILMGGDILTYISPADMRDFVRTEAQDYIVGYLNDNNVDAEVIKRRP